ncbi:MAG: MFS transporter [Chloroflexi bacterium]|nr:MFS transporter [Chloroflexota bacterium]
MRLRALARARELVRFRGIFYGWWIVAGVFLAMLVHTGTYYSFGVFFKPVQLEFDWTRADVSWAIFLQQVIHGASYILAGALVDRHGPRKIIPFFAVLMFAGYTLLSRTSTLWQLYLFYGVMVGVGAGMGFAPLMSIVARWFDKRKGLALGVALSGTAVGTITMPLVASYLILYTGWRTAFIAAGVIFLVIFLGIALVLRNDPRERGLVPYGYQEVHGPHPVTIENNYASGHEGGVTLSAALLSRQAWIAIFAMGTFFFGEQMVMFHIVNYATDLGIGATSAASILSYIGIGSLAGRLMVGGLSDVVGTKRLLLVCFAGMGILLVFLVFISEMAWFGVFGVIFGLIYGGVVPLQAVLAFQLFGKRSLGAILGAVTFGTLIASALGPLLAGYIFDATQSYNYAFILAAILSGVAALLSLRLKLPGS